MIDTILFDLDGTLLPMDQDVFIKDYFKRLCAKLAPFGYDPQKLIDGIWTGTAAMIKNDGKRANEELFWDAFSKIFGEKVLADKPVFDEFYRVDFQKVKDSCGYNPLAKQTVEACKTQGFRLVLATNPIFPAVATYSRVRWAGLDPEMFALCTTYENTCFCKPNPAYYQDILRRIGSRPEQCLMIGNDVEEDMVAKNLGMHVFLLTDCLINAKQKDISVFPQGDFEALREYVKRLHA